MPFQEENTPMIHHYYAPIFKSDSIKKDSSVTQVKKESALTLSAIVKQFGLFAINTCCSKNSSLSPFLLPQKRNGAKDIRDHMKAMEKELNNTSFQAWACLMISKWAATNDHYLFMIVSSGGILNIINAMAAHPNCEAVQAQACFALGWLGGSNVMCRSRVIGTNGINSITMAMRRHPQSKIVKSGASFAIKKLTSKLTHNQTTIRTYKVQRIFNEALK